MITPEALREYPVFAPLDDDQIRYLVEAARARTVSSGEYIFHKDEELGCFYLVVEGEFEIVFESPKLEVEYEAHGQPGTLHLEQVILSTVRPGQILGWSGLVPPYRATSGGRAKVPGRVIAFDCQKLLQCFEADCRFGFYMIQAAAQAIGQRLHDVYRGGTR